MNIELTRFKVKDNKSEKVDEWLNFLRENIKEVEEGLIVEKMYVESIFRETLNGQEYLYWYSVQGDGGLDIEENSNWIAKKHLEFWHECIDENFKPVDLKTEVVMIPNKIQESMDF